MTTRESKIAKALLDVLHNLDGGQAGELTLHAEVNLMVPCSATEFGAVLALCDRQKWITGVTARLTGKMKYNLNDAGEAARLEF
jgi:hypothetical protein